MTRNADHYIEVGQLPKNEAFPQYPRRWFANLTLEPHADADVSQGVGIIFNKIFDTEEQARAWAEKLDFLLAYGHVRITRTYDL